METRGRGARRRTRRNRVATDDDAGGRNHQGPSWRSCRARRRNAIITAYVYAKLRTSADEHAVHDGEVMTKLPPRRAAEGTSPTPTGASTRSQSRRWKPRHVNSTPSAPRRCRHRKHDAYTEPELHEDIDTSPPLPSTMTSIDDREPDLVPCSSRRPPRPRSVRRNALYTFKPSTRATTRRTVSRMNYFDLGCVKIGLHRG